MVSARWTYLSEEFVAAIEQAILSDTPITRVFEHYGIDRGTYYAWLAIGEGRMTSWRDGSPISKEMQINCRRLSQRVLRAREARLRARRQAL